MCIRDRVDIGKAMEGFLTFLPPQMKIEKPVVHISLNPVSYTHLDVYKRQLLLRLYRDSDCIFLADFSNFCKFSSLLSIITYWL